MELSVCHLGRVEYREAAALQERLRERVIAGELGDLMLLLEHPPVYTIGRRSDAGDLPFGEAFYRERGIDVVRTPRGGQLTYHGPGQLVGYPIMHVTSVPEYILTMERALVKALDDAGIAGRRPSSATSTSACGSASARSPRSACCRAARPPPAEASSSRARSPPRRRSRSPAVPVKPILGGMPPNSGCATSVASSTARRRPCRSGCASA